MLSYIGLLKSFKVSFKATPSVATTAAITVMVTVLLQICNPHHACASDINWLKTQNPNQCLSKALVETFSLRLASTDQHVDPIYDSVYSNYQKEIPQNIQVDVVQDEYQKPQPLHDVRVYSKNNGYDIRFRKFSTALKGEELLFLFSSKSCIPHEIIATCLGSIPGAADQKFVSIPLQTDGNCPTVLPVDTCTGVKRYCRWFKQQFKKDKEQL